MDHGLALKPGQAMILARNSFIVCVFYRSAKMASDLFFFFLQLFPLAMPNPTRVLSSTPSPLSLAARRPVISDGVRPRSCASCSWELHQDLATLLELLPDAELGLAGDVVYLLALASGRRPGRSRCSK